MDPVTIGLIGSAGIGATSSLVNSFVSNAQSKKLMQKQFHYQKKMWEMENEYNKPVNQMARLQEAGLNPNLVYGSGATALGGSMGSVSQPSAAGLDINPINDMSNYQSIVNMMKQEDQIGATTTQIKDNTKNQNAITKADLQIKEQQALNLQAQREQTQANTMFALEQVQGQKLANGVSSIELGNIGFYGGKEQYKNAFEQQRIEQRALEESKSSLYQQLSRAFNNGIYQPTATFWNTYNPTSGTFWSNNYGTY